VKIFVDEKKQFKLNKLLIVIDEAHVPSIENYLLIALCLYIRAEGFTLRVSIMSATLDSAPLLDEFYSAPKLELDGRLFPLNYFYLTNPINNKDALIFRTIKTVRTIVEKEKRGVLVFVSGEKDIEKIVSSFNNDSDIECYGLHSKLPEEELQWAFDPPSEGCVKVVVATNAAESSLTIDGIGIVVDTLLQIKAIKAKTGRGMNYLETTVSKSSATQRAGRAGRLEEGDVYRMCTEQEFENLQDNTESDFYNLDPSIAVLEL
jgi:HrpA-like RNA helicase